MPDKPSVQPQRISIERAPASATVTAERCADRIRQRNGEVRALVCERLEAALLEDLEKRESPPTGPLYRVPYTLKDVWDTPDLPTSGGSWRHRGRRPTTAAPIYEVLRGCGAILLGKTNLCDLAFTPESQSYVGGVTANPHALERTSGGSSGGAAAAIADGMAVFDWGSDFGGSIRLPAAFCGIYGLRLSSSTYPVRGHFPEFPEDLGLNGMGPMAKSLGLLGTLVDVVAPKVRRGGPGKWSACGVALWGPDRFAAGEWPHFLDEARLLFGAAGFAAEDADLPAPQQVDSTFAAYLATHLSEVFRGRLLSTAAATLSALTLGPVLRDRRIHPQTAAVLATLGVARGSIYRDKGEARDSVEALRAAARGMWEQGMVIVSPTSGFPAPLHGRVTKTEGCTAFVKLGNVLDATGLAVPWGRFSGGLPRSLQLLGPPGSERALLDLVARLGGDRLGIDR